MGVSALVLGGTTDEEEDVEGSGVETALVAGSDGLSTGGLELGEGSTTEEVTLLVGSMGASVVSGSGVLVGKVISGGSPVGVSWVDSAPPSSGAELEGSGSSWSGRVVGMIWNGADVFGSSVSSPPSSSWLFGRTELVGSVISVMGLNSGWGVEAAALPMSA